ncbi:SipW-dependent-type signal peptide-containing protein, partial [Candidatus Bathyarchaeota archaeon]|nr:SipW-dependent-type signal peptide-containing protein [Candidatus Bathyarchaeota archaeon]
MKKGSLVISVAMLILASSLVGAGSFAYFSDVELAKLTFTSGVLDLELDYENNWYDGVPIEWSTPDYWKPGEWKELLFSLHMKPADGMGLPAKSLI